MVRLFLASSLVVISQIAFTYPTPVDFDGKLLRWDIEKGAGPILYEIVSESAPAVFIYDEMINEAAKQWTDVDSSYFEYAPANDDEVADVTIELQSNFADASFSSGFALFDEKDDSGPRHCQIIVAISDRTVLNIRKTVLHELGHCLGLGHSLIPESVMSYRNDKNDFKLDVDDRAAISRLYPMDDSEPGLPQGCAVLSGELLVGSWYGLLILFLLPIPLFVLISIKTSSCLRTQPIHISPGPPTIANYKSPNDVTR